ncbi:MAG: HAMP domain-containing histidine kinase [Deltaproteobacteria bacterium]|nr:HAMP domain-containing histidine kinase [Deltaproteobacteria bacterium]
MYLNKMLRPPRTLASRLTLWYAGIFIISTLVAFGAFYLVISTVISKNTDQDLMEDVQGYSSMLTAEGIDQVKSEMAWEALSDGQEHIFLRLLTMDGKEVAATDMSAWRSVGTGRHALEKLKRGADYVLETLDLPEQEFKARTVYGSIGPDLVLQIGESLEEDEEFLELHRIVFIPIMAVMAIIAAIVGWLMARRALTGVEEVTQTAIEISKGALDKRVPFKARGDEIERLATTFNYMLDRINVLIKGMREMSDNIAHDLRSPLARIRGVAEMALTTSANDEEYKAMAGSMLEECDRLLGMINAMLDIAEAESGAGETKLEAVDLVGIIQRACELFQAIAEENSVTIATELPEICLVYGEARKFQRMVANLLDNALKFTPPQGTVKVSLKADNGQVALSVSDTGIGISEDDLPHVFKRFYRCDNSRAQQGTGLGLSLVKAIAGSLGGSVNATSHLGKGSTFTVTIPQLPLSHQFQPAK